VSYAETKVKIKIVHGKINRVEFKVMYNNFNFFPPPSPYKKYATATLIQLVFKQYCDVGNN